MKLGLGDRVRAAMREFASPRRVPVSYRAPDAEAPPAALLDGKRALVVGGGGQIGHAIMVELSKERAAIEFTELDEDTLRAETKALRSAGITATGVASDISDPDQIDALVAGLAVPPDIVVINAATRIGKLGLDANEWAGWRRTFDTNVLGPFRLAEKLARVMIESGRPGAFVFITSGHDHSVSRWPDYSSSKAAVAMVIRELAVELGPHGIRVNGVAPGAAGVDEEGIPPRFRFTPLYGTAVDPKYIARAVLYLAADHFSHATTGIVIDVDGGLGLYSHRVAQEPPG